MRDAVDRLLPQDEAMSLVEAGDLLLEAEPIDVDDWDAMKDELLAPDVA